MMKIHKQRSIWIWVISLVALGFGVLTVREGGTILFGDEAVRMAAGNFVPFVLWFNFVHGVRLHDHRRRALDATTLGGMAGRCHCLGNRVTFVAFGVHVFLGGAYEQRTVIAMSLRTLVWAVIAAIAWQQLFQSNPGGTSESGEKVAQ